MHAMDNTTEKRTIQKKNRNYNNTDIYFIVKKLACNNMYYRHRHKEHKQYTTHNTYMMNIKLIRYGNTSFSNQHDRHTYK